MGDYSLSCNTSLHSSHAVPAQRGRYGESAKDIAPLGIVTKTSSPFDLKDFFSPKTGEIKQEIDHSQARSNRWALKSVVNKILPKSRTSKCMVLRAPHPLGGLSDIEIRKSPKHGKAFYHGLLACGSIWNCPICAAKISERRRVELKEALAVANEKGLRTHFVTLTFPHGISDDLNTILSKMTKAYGKLSNGKYSVKNQIKQVDPSNEIYGFIRAVEVTHGKNGFHPHIHMIVFTDPATRSTWLEYVYKKAWDRACRLSDLPKPNEHGCTVKDGSYAAEYASKWGIEDEMTKANQKKNKLKGYSPWGLLRCILDDDDLDYPPERAKSLFQVYSAAFKGKRQLYWSNGLRKLLSMSKELNDQELVNAPDDEAALQIALITLEQWVLIRKFKQESALLVIAESNPHIIPIFIKNLSIPEPIPLQ